MKTGLLFCLITFAVIVNAQVQFGPIVGAVTDTSAIVLVKTYSPDQEVNIELFTQADVAHSIFSAKIKSTKENYNYVKIPVNNLTPNTTYYYRAIVNGFASKKWNSFKTFPVEKDCSFSFGFGSCQQSSWSVPNPEIFPVIGNDSLRFFIQLGDWTYPDTTQKKYGYQFNEKKRFA